MNENETKPPRTRRIAAVRRHDAAHPDWTPQDQREDFWNTAMRVFGVSTWTEVDERDANDPRWDEICADNSGAIGADGIYHTPQAAIDAVTANPAKGKLIGVACGTNCIQAWNVKDGLSVNVATERNRDHSDIWHLRATVGGDTRMIATIFGGRWSANVYTRMVRNALTARAMKIRRNHENRKAKKAETAEAAREA